MAGGRRQGSGSKCQLDGDIALRPGTFSEDPHTFHAPHRVEGSHEWGGLCEFKRPGG